MSLTILKLFTLNDDGVLCLRYLFVPERLEFTSCVFRSLPAHISSVGAPPFFLCPIKSFNTLTTIYKEGKKKLKKSPFKLPNTDLFKTCNISLRLKEIMNLQTGVILNFEFFFPFKCEVKHTHYATAVVQASLTWI